MLNVTPETVGAGVESYKGVIRANMEDLEAKIQDLSKSGLKDLLRAYMGIQLACEILEEPFTSNHTHKEQSALQSSIKLQDDCLGYMKLTRELQEMKNEF